MNRIGHEFSNSRMFSYVWNYYFKRHLKKQPKWWMTTSFNDLKGETNIIAAGGYFLNSFAKATAIAVPMDRP